MPLGRFLGDSLVNPYLDTIKRVIGHLTIVMDDEHADTVLLHQWPGDAWVRRPGYGDSGWAAYEGWSGSECSMYWSPRLGCDGLWSLFVYKTKPPTGEGYVNSNAVFSLGSWCGGVNQAVPPFDTWQLVYGPSYLTAGSKILELDDFSRWPEAFCYTYYDAFKLECVNAGGDGGDSSSAIALGDVSQRPRVSPNPAGRTASISYVVPKQGRVDVVVYDVAGRAVLKAPQGTQRAGRQTATVSVAGLPAGAYLARVSGDGAHTTCRFVVCK